MTGRVSVEHEGDGWISNIASIFDQRFNYFTLPRLRANSIRQSAHVDINFRVTRFRKSSVGAITITVKRWGAI